MRMQRGRWSSSLWISFCFVCVVIVTASENALAQTWYVEAQAGQIRSALDPSATGQSAGAKSTLVGGVRYDHPTANFRASAAIPTKSNEPLWGSISGWKRLTFYRNRIFAGLDLAGNGFLLRERVAASSTVPLLPPSGSPSSSYGSAVAGQALPVLGFDLGILEVRGRAGMAHYRSWLETQGRQRTVQLADVQATFAPESSFIITPVLRGYRADEGNYAYAGVSGAAGYSRLTGWGMVGQWVAGRGTQSGAPWAVGATIKVHPRLGLNASRRHDTVDPLYSSPPQTSWSVGLAFQISGAPSLPPPPLPAAYVGGRATIRLPLSESPAAPRIAGDFNKWQPQPMVRSGDAWIYTLDVAPGVYSYAFINAKGEWFVPQNVPGRRDDGMGGHVAVLVVR